MKKSMTFITSCTSNYSIGNFKTKSIGFFLDLGKIQLDKSTIKFQIFLYFYL
jgi:hypothetical protein